MKQILILGSCVSRDALEFSEPGEFKLTAYFARTSLATLGGRPAPIPPELQKLPAGWRQRMVLADHDKSVLTTLAKTPFDLLLLDLIDERFNLLALPDGSFVTLSTEYVSVAARPLPGRMIRSGSPEHAKLWRQGLQRLVGSLSTQGLQDRVRVNRVFWAELDSEGREIEGFAPDRIRAANAFLEARYRDLEAVFGADVFYDYPKELFRADVKHKWGLSAFHYQAEFYRASISHLRGKNYATSRLAGEKGEAAAWSVELDIAGSQWTARIVGPAPGAPVEYAFYLMRGKERIATRWYEARPEAEFAALPAAGTYHAIGFVRKAPDAAPEFRTSALVVKEKGAIYDVHQRKLAVYEHSASDTWLIPSQQGKIKNGIHRFFLEGQDHSVDVLVDGISHVTPGGAVLVCFGGAVAQRETKVAPFFSGAGVARNLGVPVLAIADPSLSLSASLALGWYAGHAGRPDLPQKIAALLDAFALIHQSRLVVFGGSGGGFASMAVAGFLRCPATACVWNPQTSIQRYLEKAVVRYLDEAFPDTRDMDTLPARLGASGILHDLVAGQGPRRYPLLYLQNQSDELHVEQHARPFMHKQRARRVSDGVFVGEGESVFCFGNWGRGHSVPPGSLIFSILEKLCQGQDPLAIALHLEKDDKFRVKFEF